MAPEAYFAWVDPRNRVVSFLPHQGFQKRSFSTHSEMLQFVVALGFSGYGIL